jgi:hypothetical protein
VSSFICSRQQLSATSTANNNMTSSMAEQLTSPLGHGWPSTWNNNNDDDRPFDMDQALPSSSSSFSSPFLDACGSNMLTLWTFVWKWSKWIIQNVWRLLASLLTAENSGRLSMGSKLMVTLYTYVAIWTKASLTFMDAFSWLLQVHQYLLAAMTILTLLIGAGCLLWLYEFMWWQVPSIFTSLGASSRIQQQHEPLLMEEEEERSEIRQQQQELFPNTTAQRPRLQQRMVMIDHPSYDNNSNDWCSATTRYGGPTVVRVLGIFFVWGIFCFVNTYLELWVFYHYQMAHPDYNFELYLVNALEAMPLFLGAAYTLRRHLYPILYSSWQVATATTSGSSSNNNNNNHGGDNYAGEHGIRANYHSSSDTAVVQSLM